jgi:hypothetical protein
MSRQSWIKRIGIFTFETWLFEERPWAFSISSVAIYAVIFGRVFWFDWKSVSLGKDLA